METHGKYSRFNIQLQQITKIPLLSNVDSKPWVIIKYNKIKVHWQMKGKTKICNFHFALRKRRFIYMELNHLDIIWLPL